MKSTTILERFAFLLGAVLFSSALITPAAIADNTVLYFVRHTEKQDQLEQIETNIGMCLANDCIEYKPGKTCCTEELSDLGILHRNKLADWFLKNQITPKLTRVFSSHKQRTTQTVQVIADDAGLDVERLGPEECLAPSASECADGCESGKVSINATVEAIDALAPGSTVLIGQHSGTIYLIMEELGIDTSDEEDFPRDSEDKVAGYNNLWKVTIMESGKVKTKHLVLDLTLERTR